MSGGTRRGFLGKLLGGAAISNLVQFEFPAPPPPRALDVQEFPLRISPQNIGPVSEGGNLPIGYPNTRTYRAFYNPTDHEVSVIFDGKKLVVPAGEARYLTENGARRCPVPRGLRGRT